jgi:hypothetical protein
LAQRGAAVTTNSILVHRPGAPIAHLPVDAAHAEVFDFEEFLDAVFRAFAADAAFLHAAEGGDLGRDDAFVDADDAVFEGLGDAPDAADVAAAGEDIRRSFSGSRSQQQPGRSAELPEKGLVNGLVEKTVRDGIANRQPVAKNRIIILFDDSPGQQHLQQSR